MNIVVTKLPYIYKPESKEEFFDFLDEFAGLKRIYVAGPYRGKNPTVWNITQNINEAKKIARELWIEGHGEWGIICPHANTAHMDDLGETDQYFLRGDLWLLEACDLVVLMPNWEESFGSRKEVKWAMQNNIPIVVWPNNRTPCITDDYEY